MNAEYIVCYGDDIVEACRFNSLRGAKNYINIVASNPSEWEAWKIYQIEPRSKGSMRLTIYREG